MAYDASKRFILEMQRGSPRRWLSLLGVSGVGKSHLAKNIAALVSDSIYFRWHRVMDIMRSGDFGIIEYLCQSSIVIVDDIGMGYDSELSKAKLEELCERRENKWTVFTSNFDYNGIGEHFGLRVSSRMVRGENEVIEMMTCPDYSLSKYKTNHNNHNEQN